MLLAAGQVHCDDAALGVRHRNPGMTVAPAIMGAIHLVSVRVLES